MTPSHADSLVQAIDNLKNGQSTAYTEAAGHITEAITLLKNENAEVIGKLVEILEALKEKTQSSPTTATEIHHHYKTQNIVQIQPQAKYFYWNGWEWAEISYQSPTNLVLR